MTIEAVYPEMENVPYAYLLVVNEIGSKYYG
jgi:hypothetical protein